MAAHTKHYQTFTNRLLHLNADLELVDIIDIKVPEYDYLHTLVIIKKVSHTPKLYPRKNSVIKKKAL